MRTVFQFGERELKSIIAHHYDVSEDKVTIRVGKNLIGYGLNERFAHKIIVEVETYSDEN